MISLRYVMALVAFALIQAAAASPAAGQSSYFETYVASYGNDSSANCSRTAPCRNLYIAYGKTSIGGSVTCLGPSTFYQGMTITRSITVSCRGEENSVYTVVNAFTVNAPGANVVIRGFEMHGTSGNDGEHGVRVEQANSVTIEDCSIRDFRAAGDGVGIGLFNGSGTVELIVRRTDIMNNGGMGILVLPSGGGAAKVAISDSNISNNFVGIQADTSIATGLIDMTVKNTIVTGHTSSGLVLIGGAGSVNVIADGVTTANNSSRGVAVTNATATLFVRNSTISGNTVGTEVVNGGRIQSHGNNMINGNRSNGVFPTIIPQR